MRMNRLRKAIVCFIVSMVMWIPLIIMMFLVDTYPGWLNEYPFMYVLLGISVVGFLGVYYELWMNGREE